MSVFQIRIKTYTLKAIPFTEMQNKVIEFIDGILIKNEEMLKFHNINNFKLYTADSLYPTPKAGIYKSDTIYTLTIRTVDANLANYLATKLPNHYNAHLKGLTGEIKIIPQRFINQLYTLTPAIVKTENGYWKGNLSLQEYEARIKINLVKKYNQFHQTTLDEDFELYTVIEFLNDRPIPVPYKNIRLLGDKLRLTIADNPTAQKLAYFSLGTGIGEANSRGFGFVNYKWL